MCVVSFIGDNWRETFPQRWPNVPLQPYVAQPDWSQTPHKFEGIQDELRTCSYCGNGRDHWLHAAFEPARGGEISKKDFDALRKEVEELKKLLLAAKAYDEATGQKDCEIDEKVELIRQVAELVGVDVDEVFGSREQ